MVRKYLGRAVTQFQVVSFLKNEYLKGTTSANSLHSFAETGIYSFNANVFEERLFSP